MQKQKLLKEYSKSSRITKCLQDAEKIESEFAEGFPLSDSVRLCARINPKTGLWEAILDSPLGSVVYKAQEPSFKVIQVSSIPDISRIEDKESYSNIELQQIAYSYRKEFLIDLTDIRSIHQAKKHFEDDYTLSNLFVENDPSKHSAAELLAIHIRKYQKIFKSYERSFSFLWDQTQFKNASMICSEMRKVGYWR